MAENKSTILVVEDDSDLAEMLTAFFRKQGYEVFSVSSGEDAVQRSHFVHPDLVILDIRLPDIDGFEVARRLRGQPRTSDIPIIFLTEMRDRADRLQGLEAGADDYVTKPFDIQELRLRVRNALRRNVEGSLTNPVTHLPEGALVEERLQECLHTKDWSLLLVAVDHLSEFREAYGFVAADDVQRAVGLMVHNAMRDVGGTGDFIGQVSQVEFLVFTQPASLFLLAERIRTRLEQSLEYFYPLKDRAPALEKPAQGPAPPSKRLRIRINHLSAADGPFGSVNELKQRLISH